MFFIKILKNICKLIYFIFKKMKDVNCGVYFLINFLISIYIFTKTMKKVSKFKNQTEIILDKLENYTHISDKYLHFSIEDYENIIIHIKAYFFVAIFSVIFSNVLHLLLASLFPKTYVNISSYAYIFLFFSISAMINFFIFFIHQKIASQQIRNIFIIIGITSAVIGILLILYIKKYNQSSILLIKASSSLIGKYPFLLFLAFIQSALLFIMNFIFTLIITLSFTPIWPITHVVTLILYLLFSYYWIASTLYYICYMTISVVVKNEFQCKTTFSSFSTFVKIITCQFNNAVFAGLALTMMQFNQHRAAKKKPKLHILVKNRNKFIRILVGIFEIPGFVLSYLMTFVFSVMESVLRDISSNALIYCVLYECSYKEGTEKWLKEGVDERINKFNQNVMIKNILFCHRVIFTVLALLFSMLTLYLYGNLLEIYDFIVTFVLTLILMHSGFSILCTLIKTTSETLFICFVETPQNMNERFKSLYLQLNK